MPELWKDIPGYEHYQASDLGRIRSLERQVPCYGGFRRVRGMVLKDFLSRSTGYMQVDIRGKRTSAHRLVALAWCEGYFDGAWVDHKNGQRADNRPSNLHWVTPSENSALSYKNGRKNPFEGKHSSDHPTSKSVESRCLTSGAVTSWPSAMDAVRAGFESASISRCCSGSSKFHKGHAWRFGGDRHGVKWSDGQ